ncbi:hypothetical protein [Hymenobacter sp. CRA2]|uniref:hypothetical protein n=1 Tax=Hymenobacter sp. CRA2 TaxID=1955620 RepID=UPI00111648CB|nr:hypothetical protein [Hymenobacter sp. CRA2]
MPRLAAAVMLTFTALEAQAQRLTLQEMRSLLGQPLMADNKFMVSRGYSYGDVTGNKIAWLSNEGIIYAYALGTERKIDRVELSGPTAKWFRGLLNQLPAAQLLPEGSLRRGVNKTRWRLYAGSDYGVVVYLGGGKTSDGLIVYTLAQYQMLKQQLRQEPL